MERRGGRALDVVGIGAVNLDYVLIGGRPADVPGLGEVEPDRERRFASEARANEAIEHVTARSHSLRVGGSAFNVIHTMGRMGAVRRLGFVGIEGEMPDDPQLEHGTYGRPAFDLLNQVHVNGEALIPSTSRSGLCVAGQDGEGRRLRTWPGANLEMADRLRDDQMRSALLTYLERASIVHVTSFLDTDTPALLTALLTELKRRRPTTRISLDPGFSWVEEPPEGVEQLLRLADLVFLNRREFFELAGSAEHEDERVMAGRIFERCSRNCAVVVLKLREGATVFCDAGEATPRSFEAHRQPSTSVDDTGAGDTFAAGFLSGLVHTAHIPLVQSAHLGARVAARRIRHPTPEWYGPVADASHQFLAQLPQPSVEQPDTVRHVLTGGDVPETLDLLCTFAPRMFDAARHLDAAVRATQEPSPWTEAKLQQLTKALLSTLFSDVRAEEYSHSVNGKNCRIDLLLKRHGVGVEIELAGVNKRDAALGKEIDRHIVDYAGHPDVRGMLALLFDPEHNLANPHGLCRDLTREREGIDVRAVVLGRDHTALTGG